MLPSWCHHLKTTIKAILSCSYQLRVSVTMLHSNAIFLSHKKWVKKHIIALTIFSAREKRKKYVARKKSNTINWSQQWHPDTTLLMVPSWCAHPDATSVMLQTQCYQQSTTISMLLSWCYRPDTTVLLLPSWHYRPNATVTMLPSWHYHHNATILTLPSWHYVTMLRS